MRPAFLLVPVLLASSALSAKAEEAGRYTLEKSPTGYVRMDTRTGEMSICEERGGQLICKLAADERAAFQDELDRLEAKLTGLEQRLAALENSPVLKPQKLLPTEEEFQRSLGYMERFFRKFLDIVRDADKESGTPEKT
ncbi:MAG TPA: hypothetical protein VNS34_14155 [Rhizobiaceae bacterium]|nr:hypothetical protein [Rhizobiaceae bacterium]